MSEWLRGLPQWSISRQLGLLIFGALLLLTTANFLVTFVGPPPRPAPVPLANVAGMLSGHAVSMPQSRMTPVERVGSFVPRAGEARHAAYEAQLARLMRAPLSHVRLANESPISGSRGAPPSGDLLGSFSAAVRDESGTWSVVRSTPQPLFTAWHRTVLLATVLIALMLGAGAALISRGIVSPLHRLAEQADHAYLDGKRSPIHVDGPPEIAQLARTIAAMRDRFADLVEGRTMMLAAIAHDMASPLARLEFRVARLPEDARAEAEKDLAELSSLIASILSYAKGAGELETTLVNLVAVAREVVERGSGPMAVTMADGPAAAWIWGDRLAMRRLISNLVGNAERYAGNGRLSIVEQQGRVLLTLEDSGPGFPPALAERLFEPFFRVERSRSRETAGVGLGLAVARSIAEAHGGTLTASSRLEGGSCFVLTLPASGSSDPRPS